jgi:hypothetical protein
MLFAVVALGECIAMWTFLSAVSDGTNAVFACAEGLTAAALGIMGIYVLCHEAVLWLMLPEPFFDDGPPVASGHIVGG